MSFYDEAWFVHGLSDTVYQLAQQKKTAFYSGVRVKEGVTGKTIPWNRVGPIDMRPVTARHMVGVGADVPKTKRRMALKDYYVRAYVDDLDQVRALPNLQSEDTQQIANTRNRQLDVLIVQGMLGLATNVDEAGESTSTTALPTSGGPGNVGQVIANGGTGLTLTKIMDTKWIFDENNVDPEERYFAYSPRAMRKLLEDTKVTSSDYNTMRALVAGGFADNETWHGFKWRSSTLLPKNGDITLPEGTVYPVFTGAGANIRSCVAWQKSAVGCGVAGIGGITVKDRPDLVRTTQVELVLSAGSIRIEEIGVVRVDIDESA